MIEILILAIILLISISVHEFAHAWVSYKLWDPTPKYQWRLTLNPIAHIDPIGFLMIFIIHFGWWRPVEVNPRYYKNPLLWELIVALAGPFSNLLLAFFWTFLLVLLIKFFWMKIFYFWDLTFEWFLYKFFYLFSLINVGLAIFNLLPFPPLDWYRLIKYFFPRVWVWIDKNLFYLSLGFLLLLFLPGTWDVIKSIVVAVSKEVFNIFYVFWTMILL